MFVLTTKPITIKFGIQIDYQITTKIKLQATFYQKNNP